MDVMKKKQMLATLVMLSLLHGSVYAEINERPEVGKQYDEYLYYDANGSQNFSLQGSVKGEKHNYYFNAGATLDSSNDSIHSAILAHNWGEFDTETAEIFHIGDGKDFIVKSYKGYGNLEAEEGATLQIEGGNVVLESGIVSTSGMDNTDSAIHMESKGELKINSDSLWIGNKRTEDRHNVGAISMAGDANVVDIDLKEDFIAENVDMGLALQTQGDGTYALADIHTGEDISITAQRSDGHAASGYRGAGIYSLSYYHANSSSTVNFISDNGNITVNAQGYALYAYGNTPVLMQANNGNITLHSNEKQGIYAKGYFDENTNEIDLSAQNISIVSDKNYGLYANNSKVELNASDLLEVKNIGNESRGLYTTGNAVVNATALKVDIAGDKYGIYGSSSGTVNANADYLSVKANDGWSVCLFSGSTANLKANTAEYYDDIYVSEATLNAFANSNDINGQVRVLDGGTATFASANEVVAGTATINHTTSDAVTATSDEKEVSEILFKQATFINSQGDEEYHADKQGVRTNSAIRANRNSVITLDKAAGIYGDIIAGRGNDDKNAVGGKVIINSIEGADFKGDVLAGNGGEINFTLNGANYEGRIDDYADATLKDMVFRPEEFDVEVNSGGTVNLTLNNNSTWTARGQNFVTELNFGEDGGVVDLSKETNNSVTIRNLKGGGTFNMLLNSENHALSDMLYIGKNEGKQTINIVGGITGGLENISEDNPLRFATVGIDTVSANPDVNNSGIRAYTRDGGVFDLEYFVDKEGYNPDDINNELYNGYDDGKDGSGNDIDKPGNDFVEDVLVANGTNAVNWIITGAKEAKQSDAGKTIINMSKVNYNNAIYMDRLNKRLGEARYINPEEEQGMWVRIRHDRIGKKDAFRSQNTMYEMGYDEKQDCDNGERRVGFAIDYMDGKAEYTGIAGDGDVKRYGLWLYDTWLGDKGHYADYVAKWGHLENDFDIMARSTGEKITGDYSNNVFSVSAEYGKKNDMGNNWYFEPQAQLQLARVTGADYVTTQGTKVSLDGINSLIGRAGFRLGRDLDENSTVYVKADLLHEFLGEQDIAATDLTGTLRETYENKGTWYDVGFGFATALGKNSYAFMDFEKSFGNDNDETYQINAGVQWTF